MDYKLHTPGKSRAGLRRNVLFGRTHSHLEAGRATSGDSNTGPPTPSVTLPDPCQVCFLSVHPYLYYLPAQKLMRTSHCMPCSGKTPFRVGGLSPRRLSGPTLSVLLGQMPRFLSACRDLCSFPHIYYPPSSLWARDNFFDATSSLENYLIYKCYLSLL